MVELVRAEQAAAVARGQQPALYGAKITGGGSGGERRSRAGAFSSRDPHATALIIANLTCLSFLGQARSASWDQRATTAMQRLRGFASCMPSSLARGNLRRSAARPRGLTHLDICGYASSKTSDRFYFLTPDSFRMSRTRRKPSVNSRCLTTAVLITRTRRSRALNAFSFRNLRVLSKR